MTKSYSPTATPSLLSPAQVEQFVRDGYVSVPALIPPERMAACRRQMWDALGIDPDDSRTWPENPIIVPHEVHGLMTPCRTPTMETVAEQLVGPGFARGGGFSPVLNFPRPGSHEFVPLGFHIDGTDESTLWPVHRYLILLAYLTDTTEYGGALAVRPGSHRQALAHWVRAGTEPGGSTVPPALPYAEPVPVPGKAGDVVFLHYLLVHASSHNRDNHVRVGLNGTIRPDPVPVGYPKSGLPQSDWTPIERTLCIENLDVT